MPQGVGHDVGQSGPANRASEAAAAAAAVAYIDDPLALVVDDEAVLGAAPLRQAEERQQRPRDRLAPHLALIRLARLRQPEINTRRLAV